MRNLFLSLTLLILVGCPMDDCNNNPLGSDGIGTPGTMAGDITKPSEPDELNVDQYPKVDSLGSILTVNSEPMRMFSAFSASIRDRGYTYQLCQKALSYGHNTARVLGHQPTWSGWLVPFEYNRAAMSEAIKGFGDAGCAVQLVVGNKRLGLKGNKSLTTKIISHFKDYPNVFYSLGNEYHTSMTPKEMIELTKIAKAAGAGIVGFDDEAFVRPIRFKTDAFSVLVDYFAWHPPRNDPKAETVDFYKTGVRTARGKAVLFDELLAYATTEDLEAEYSLFQGSSLIAMNGQVGTTKKQKKELDKQRFQHAKKQVVNVITAGGVPCWHSLKLITLRHPVQDIRFPNIYGVN